MTRNVGSIDRIVRIVVGLVLLGVALTVPNAWWAYIGIVPLVTGALGTCPAYRLIGLSTCPLKPGRGAEA